MNINTAKEDIKNTIKIYLKKDEFGDYRIPVVRQRPIFLLGAPGIGKTAIMEQIAAELGIALVSYSMTHHTRQSALGLPFIKQKEYHGKTYDVSEYTMSEIIASIYDTMEESGVEEGILFLDEINCVSETLAPSMLQFLQYKVFGKHSVPEGWVIVTAGNPPMYNKSVREFDVVTMDRLKIIEVEADYETWKEYAKDRDINSAVLSFLELKKEYFYHMETTVKGRSYITARGWEDLSQMINLYEEEGLKVDESVVSQYLRNDMVVKEFTAYYDLYQKYKNDYRIEDILAGDIPEKAVSRAKNAEFDERLSLLGMLLDKITGEMKEIVTTSDYLTDIMTPLRMLKNTDSVFDMLGKLETGKEKQIENLERANALSKEEKNKLKREQRFFANAKKTVSAAGTSDDRDGFAVVKQMFDTQVNNMRNQVDSLSKKLTNLFRFTATAFEEGNEMLILVTELTVGKFSSRYISMFGCEEYHRYNGMLMLTERQNEMTENIKKLNLEY